MPTACTILIDISGSVNSDLVEAAVNSIIATNSGIDMKNSHIIFCDSSVQYDCILSKHNKRIYSGGGTTMANGIKYIRNHKYMRKSTDKLFIISDMEDNLQSWIEEANKLPGIKWAVGYNVHNAEQAKNTIMRQYGVRDMNTFIDQWNKTFKTVFIDTRN
jgi:predicted metal-dependent peptidase